MSLYTLCANVTAVQAGPTSSGSQTIKPTAPGRTALTSFEFVAKLTGTGSCSATVQVVGFNTDGDYIKLFTMAPTSANADQSPGLDSAGWNNAPYDRYGAYVTAISGTNAAVGVVMSG